ncbi:MAG: hypothetical protein JXC32_05400 [Anaerolineae bacterium]|nr:hypothetical protein [Anaerolineae bacterium]
MDEQRDEESRPAAGGPGPVVESSNWGRQIVGALIGGGLVLILGTVAQQLGWVQQSLGRYVMWGGVVGALFGASETLERAGRRLTRRDEAWLNITVSLIGMAVVFAALLGLTRGVFALIQWFG